MKNVCRRFWQESDILSLNILVKFSKRAKHMVMFCLKRVIELNCLVQLNFHDVSCDTESIYSNKILIIQLHAGAMTKRVNDILLT